MTTIHFTSHSFECSAGGDTPEQALERFKESWTIGRIPGAVLEMVERSFTEGICVCQAGCVLTTITK